MRMPTRTSGEPFLVTLGKWVADQAALQRLDFDEVADVYRRGGGRWPASNPVQVSKLRVFWRFGNAEGAEGVLYLRGWIPHRKGRLSVGETLLADLRDRLR